MAQALPLLKLAGLLVRTVTKPMAQSIEHRAKTNKTLGDQAAYIGQFIHQITTRVNVVSQGYKFVGAKPVSHDEAVGKGAKFMSETVIMCIAMSVTTFEYLRSEKEKKEKEAVKKEIETQRKAELNQRLSNLENNMDIIMKKLDKKKSWW